MGGLWGVGWVGFGGDCRGFGGLAGGFGGTMFGLDLGAGFAKFTNEVQHSVRVLPWERIINRVPLKNDVRFPDYRPRDTQSAKSRQVWIARHQRLLEN